MDYKELVERLKSPTWQDLEDPDSTLLSEAETAITNLLARAEAADARAEKAERDIAELMGISPQERITTCFGHPLDRVRELVEAGKMLMAAGIDPRRHTMACYNLIGYRGDTFDAAQERMEQTIRAGFMPYAMLYRDAEGKTDADWRRFQREWCRPAIVSHMFGEVWKNG